MMRNIFILACALLPAQLQAQSPAELGDTLPARKFTFGLLENLWNLPRERQDTLDSPVGYYWSLDDASNGNGFIAFESNGAFEGFYPFQESELMGYNESVELESRELTGGGRPELLVWTHLHDANNGQGFSWEEDLKGLQIWDLDTQTRLCEFIWSYVHEGGYAEDPENENSEWHDEYNCFLYEVVLSEGLLQLVPMPSCRDEQEPPPMVSFRLSGGHWVKK